MTGAPLTYGQLSVLRSLAVHGDDGAPVANLVSAWEIAPGPDVAQVQDAWHRLVAAHESLRTTIAADGDGFAPTVHPFAATALDTVELPGADHAAALSAAAELAAEPIDVATRWPWRAAIVTDGGDPAFLITVIHHVAADNDALRLLEEQFHRAVDGARVQADVQPADLADAQRRVPNAPSLQHWTQVWPTLCAQDREPHDRSVRRRASLYSVDAFAATQRVSERLRVSVQSVLLCVGALVLARRERRDRLTVALMTANRLDPRWTGLVGSLNQYGPVTLALDGDLHPDRLLTTVYPQCLTAYLNGSYDVDALAAALAAAGTPDPDPTAFGKHFNFLGPIDAEPAPGSAVCTGVRWKRSAQRTGPNVHLAMAVGDGLLIGVGASEQYLPGDGPAVAAAEIEAGLLSLDRGDATTLAGLDLTPVRAV